MERQACRLPAIHIKTRNKVTQKMTK
jgi:hypothetical protein